MSFLDVVLFVGAIAGLYGCVARKDGLRYWTHSFWIIALHDAMGIVCIWSAGAAVAGATGILECAAVGSVLLWLTGSAYSWHARVPWYFDKHRTEFHNRRSYDR